MATLVQILGREGSGKTISAKTLDPKSTFIINADKKNLPFKNWRSIYNKENKNYLRSSDMGEIMAIMKLISTKAPHIKVIMIDTINSIMSDKEMSERKKVGYDKWMDLAGTIYDLYNFINEELREDLIVYVVGHVEPYEVDFETYWRLKTNGQKLTKLNVEGKTTYTLYTKVERLSDDEVVYSFLTQSDGKNTARSPEGCFDSYKIPNDLAYVAEKINEFEK